jgi:hypothetical protein
MNEYERIYKESFPGIELPIIELKEPHIKSKQSRKRKGGKRTLRKTRRLRK